MVNQDTREYSLFLKDMYGTRYSVTAVWLESIAEVKRALDVKLFSAHVPQ